MIQITEQKLKAAIQIALGSEGIYTDKLQDVLIHDIKALSIPVVIESVCKGDYLLNDKCRKYGGMCSKKHCDYWQTVL